jgi:uncharacterized protein (DUF1501 family)
VKDTRLTRRQFLKGAAAGATGLVPQLFFAGSAEAAAPSNSVLVVIHMDGGCDALNTVVPYQDPAYTKARPTLAIASSSVLPIGSGLGLHPALTGLKTLYDANKVAIVNNVGYPSFNRSHFQAEDIYWSADPKQQTGTGWLGRYLDRYSAGKPLAGAYLGAAVPKSMIGDSALVPAIPSATGYTYQFSTTAADAAVQGQAALRIIGQAPTGRTFYDGLLAADIAARDSIASVQSAVSGYQTGVSYGSDGLSQSLKLAAQLIRADIGVRVLSTSFGDFDTHANQATRLQNSLNQLSAALASFQQDAAAGGFAQRTLVFVWSEFSRRVAENASSGTDHGKAIPAIVVGEGVKGGIYGGNPDLTNLDNGDLRMTTDFRSVYATLLSGWLGADPVPILGQSWSTVPFLL